MKMIILGAAGFLGSTTAAYLLQNTDYSVVSIDNLGFLQDLHNLESVLRSRIRHTMHIMDPKYEDLMQKVLKIEKSTEPIDIFCTIGGCGDRVETLRSLCNVLLKIGMPVRKMICVQSSATADKYCPDDNHRLECLLSEYPDLPVIILNTCRIFGHRQHPSHFIPSSIQSLLNNNFYKICDDSNIFEWIYIKDFFSAIMAILNNGSRGIYTVSSNQSATEKDIYDKLASITGKSNEDKPFISISSVPLPNSLSALGWQPQFSLAESLEHTADWYNKNRWAYRGKVW